MPAKLATVMEFCQKFSIEASDAYYQAIKNTLESTTLHLESLIGTNLSRKLHTEVFWIHPSVQPFSEFYVKLILRNGLVVANTVSLKTAKSLKDLTISNEEASASDYIPDYEKGLIQFLNTQSCESGLAIKVTYESGLLVVPDGMFGTLFDDVPDWLKEAAFMFAMDRLKDTLVTGNPDAVKGITANRYIVPFLRECNAGYKSIAAR